MIEVEVKARAAHSRVRPVLENIGAKKLGIEEQFDTYFSSPYRDFSKTDEALRIRVLNGEAVLTYKGKKLDRVSKTRAEFETPVDETSTTKILHALGFSEAGEVRKKREVFEAGDITVCLDSVEDLGEFLEVEIMAEDGNQLEALREHLFDFLKQFGIEKEDSIQTSYLEMVLEKLKN